MISLKMKLIQFSNLIHWLTHYIAVFTGGIKFLFAHFRIFFKNLQSVTTLVVAHVMAVLK